MGKWGLVAVCPGFQKATELAAATRTVATTKTAIVALSIKTKTSVNLICTTLKPLNSVSETLKCREI